MAKIRARGRSLRVGDSGFTVAEMVIAAAILFIVLVGVLGAVEFAGAATRQAAMQQAAIDVATQMIERTRAMAFTSVGTYYADGSVGSPAGSIPAVQTTTTAQGVFTVTTSISYNLDNSGGTSTTSTKKMIITVSWASPSPGGHISVETNIGGKGTPSGIVKLTAQDADNPSILIPGVIFKLDPATGANMNQVSGTDGVVVFGDVPGGSTSVIPTSSVYLVDMTGIGTSGDFSIATFNVVGNTFNDKGFVPCQTPCTASMKVQSSGGAAIAGATVRLTATGSTHGGPYTAISDSAGMAYFDAAHGDVNNTPGLWAGTYSVYATYVSNNSTTQTFSFAHGGMSDTGIVLTVNNPPNLTVRIYDAITNAQITASPMTVVAKDPSNAALPGSGGVFAGPSAQFDITGRPAGAYTATVSGVSGYQTGSGSVTISPVAPGTYYCNVYLTPLQVVDVTDTLVGSHNMSGINVTARNSGGTAINAVSGTSPGIAASDGTVSFPIPAASDYTISAVVNGITYSGSPSPLPIDPTHPVTTPSYLIPITPGTMRVTVTTGAGSGWQRLVGVFDSNGVFVAQAMATKTANTVTFTDVFPGMYKVNAFASGVTSATASPTGWTTYWYTLTSPGIRSNQTYSQPYWKQGTTSMNSISAPP